MKRHAIICALFSALTAFAHAEEPAQRTPAESSAVARASQIFWDGVGALNLIFTSIGVLSGGAERGEIWTFDLHTGQRRQIGSDDDLAWPVLAPDGSTIFALRRDQLVRLDFSGAGTATVAGEAGWRKLLGVSPDGAVLGFVKGSPGVRPAILSSTGELQTFQHSESAEKKNASIILLEENRAYTRGRSLVVKRSERGGRGFDVFLETKSHERNETKSHERNLSDCGDDACGQPSLSPDGQRVLYIRAARH